VEARANDVQFCLRERAFHAEDKARRSAVA
jgi:hypothetical protein